MTTRLGRGLGELVLTIDEMVKSILSKDETFSAHLSFSHPQSSPLLL
jgi:hypothetical protein